VLTLENAKKMLLDQKPAPSFLPVEDDNTVDMNSFRFGTLSSLVGHQARGAYLPLPPWGGKNSPKALRDPVEATREQVTSAVTALDQVGPSGFYGPGSGSSDSGRSSSSSSSSESSDGQRADSESDSDDSSDDSTSSSNSNEDGNNLLGPTKHSNVPTNGMLNNMLATNLLQPITQEPLPAFQGHLSSQLSSDDEISSSDDDSSSSSSSSSSSDDEDYNGDVSSTNIITSPREGNLLSMGGGMPALKSSFEPVSGATNGGSSAMDDLRGLVMAPIALDETQASDPDIDNDSSQWIQLVRPELCGGLSVKARYMRGASKEREVQLKGLDPKSPSVVCVQVQFGNK
jgi:AP-3 complex subunit beta